MTAEAPTGSRGRWLGFLLESVAIVLSILLAFAIDAGWAERQDRRAERGILQALAVEFEAYSDQFVRRSEFYAEIAESIVWLLDEAEFSPSEIERLDEAMLAFVGAPTLDVGSGVNAELVASGRVGLLSDPDLRRLVSTWQGLLAETTDNEEVVRQFAISVVVPYLASHHAPIGRISRTVHGDMWQLSVAPDSETVHVYRLLRDDPEFRALASWRYEWALGSKDDFQAAAMVADSALSLVRASLAD